MTDANPRAPLRRSAAPDPLDIAVEPEREPLRRDASTLSAIDTAAAPPPVVTAPPPRRRWLMLTLASGALLLLALMLAELVALIDTLASWHWLLALPLAILGVAFLLGGAVFSLREWSHSRRLQQLSALRARGDTLAASDAGGGREAAGYVGEVRALYRQRPPLNDALEQLDARLETHHSGAEQVALLSSALRPLDREALGLIAATVRRTGVLAALNPLALLDSIAVTWLSLRMVRQLAEVYGGRPGLIGSWRLAREVAVAVTAAGAADLVSDSAADLAGAGLGGLVSSRFGQGVVVGLLVARVGLCALRLSRPVPLADEHDRLWQELRAEVFSIWPKENK